MPAGHPFFDVRFGLFDAYSSPTLTAQRIQREGLTESAWIISFGNGTVFLQFDLLADRRHVWCVRGGMNADRY